MYDLCITKRITINKDFLHLDKPLSQLDSIIISLYSKWLPSLASLLSVPWHGTEIIRQLGQVLSHLDGIGETFRIKFEHQVTLTICWKLTSKYCWIFFVVFKWSKFCQPASSSKGELPECLQQRSLIESQSMSSSYLSWVESIFSCNVSNLKRR